jgi:hypothetical protein
MPQTALPSPTELQDGEGGCEPRAPPRAESGGGGCKCCLEAADGPHWLGARRRPLRGAADAALRLDTGSKVHCGELLAICDRGARPSGSGVVTCPSYARPSSGKSAPRGAANSRSLSTARSVIRAHNLQSRSPDTDPFRRLPWTPCTHFLPFWNRDSPAPQALAPLRSPLLPLEAFPAQYWPSVCLLLASCSACA